MTVEQLSELLSAAAEQAAERLDAVAEKMNALAGSEPVSLLLDTAQAEERIAALKRSADQLLTDLSGNQVTASALAGAQRDYEGAIGQLETLKSLSRVTYEQELEYLQAIRDNMRRYGLSTQDALDLEQRLLSVQEQILQRDAQSLDTLLSGITSALAARYQTMRDAELTLLSESREAWKTWQENTTDAIQAQIDALDQLSEAEDRAAEEEEHLRGIEKLQQALAYEQDAFNQGQLTAQLEDAQAAYEEWLTETAREDEKAALQSQISAVNEQAQSEIDALDAQADAVSEAYAQRLQSAALQAEAERQLMTGTQEDILSLITAFAPDYNAAGQTLGEQLLEGFTEKAGSVSGWVDSLNAMITGVQEGLNTVMQSAAESFYSEHASAAAAGVTITQQNTFNTPVETPAETAFRIRQANEALAEQLLEF